MAPKLGLYIKLALIADLPFAITEPYFTTPYPMHTMSSKKNENEFLMAFKIATTIIKTLAPVLDP